jgi:2-isopropylmalate synthase
VPYLTIDPSDVGRTYESIIRINSQSGKGGVAYIMDKEFGFRMPKPMHPEFGAMVQAVTDQAGRELARSEIEATFRKEYLTIKKPYELKSFNVTKRHFDDDETPSTASIEATVLVNGEAKEISAQGNGPLDAFCSALKGVVPAEFALCNYDEHALNSGSSAKAVAYIEIEYQDEKKFWGAGIDTDIIIASIKAVLSSLNRAANA